MVVHLHFVCWTPCCCIPSSSLFRPPDAVGFGAVNSQFVCRNKVSLFQFNLSNYKKWHMQMHMPFFVAPCVGLEPTTLRLTAECSTDWANEEYIKSWRLPIFPGSHPPSIFSIEELNCRVRDGYGCFLFIIITRILFTFCISFIPYFLGIVNIMYLKNYITTLGQDLDLLVLVT